MIKETFGGCWTHIRERILDTVMGASTEVDLDITIHYPEELWEIYVVDIGDDFTLVLHFEMHPIGGQIWELEEIRG